MSEKTMLTEAELRAAEREVLERERAVMEAEKRLKAASDSDRIDYLFDKINANQRVVIEVPQPVIRVKQSNPLDGMTAVAAIVAAVFAVATLIVSVI